MITLEDARKVIAAAERKAEALRSAHEHCGSRRRRQFSGARAHGWGLDRQY